MSHRIDVLAHGNRLRVLPPGQKLAFAAVLLILALVTPPPLQLLISLWLAVWIVGYAGIPARFYLPMLLLPLGVALSSLPAIVINGVSREAFPTVHADMWRGLSQPVAGWNLYISKLGLSQALRLLTRSLAATSAMFFLLLTTPFSELIQVLRKLGLPPLLLELMVHVYGFIFTLMAIVDEIMVAQRARSGYSSRRRSLRSLGLLTGQLLQRSMNTYRGLSMGLAARGFRGDLRLVSCVNHRSSPRLQAEVIGGCALLGAGTAAARTWAYRTTHSRPFRSQAPCLNSSVGSRRCGAPRWSHCPPVEASPTTTFPMGSMRSVRLERWSAGAGSLGKALRPGPYAGSVPRGRVPGRGRPRTARLDGGCLPG